MAKKKDKNKRIKRQLAQIRANAEIQCFNMQDPTTKYIERPDLQQKIVYNSNYEDNFVRSCMWPIFEMEGIDISEVSDAALAQILVENGIFDDGQLAAFVWTYLQDYKEEGNNEKEL